MLTDEKIRQFTQKMANIIKIQILDQKLLDLIDEYIQDMRETLNAAQDNANKWQDQYNENQKLRERIQLLEELRAGGVVQSHVS